MPWRLFGFNGGSLDVPQRWDADGLPIYREPRLLLDYNDPSAPRRLYYFGNRVQWTLGLGSRGNTWTQWWSWRLERYTTRWSPFTIQPADYRERYKRRYGSKRVRR